ncbi:hypothetical protein [Aquimarina megaterium]|uniref:hypothetical protein n=1 Tax=Aquimarina megaterium TaxID=1443666 RepID=UPI00094598B8|nr:hypothetical protein [Aquimarina megaterium]
MKIILTTFFLAIAVITSFAQDNADTTKHMTFKGVPIDGTLNEYVLKMKKSGFTHVGTKEGVAMLKGDFAAYKDCIVGVATLKQKDLVSKITVIFPESDTWSSLSYNYYNIKELLTEKYGEPSKIVEKFDVHSEPEDDNSKMYEVKFDNCKYYTTYETEKGSIQLSIDHESVISCFVRLSYFDKINSKIIREKAKGDL